MADNNIEPVERDIDRVVRNVRALSDTEKEIVFLNLHADRLRKSYAIHKEPNFYRSPGGILLIGAVGLILFDLLFVCLRATLTFGFFTFILNAIPIFGFLAVYFFAIFAALRRAPAAVEKRAVNLLAKREVEVELPANESFKMAESILATQKGTRVSHVDPATGCLDARVKTSWFASQSHISLKAASINETRSRLTITSESLHPLWDMFPANAKIAQGLAEELEKHAEVHTLLLS